MDVTIVEQVVFRLRPGTRSATFVEANDAVDLWLAKQPGFRGRQLSVAGDGTYVDIVWWTDRDSAEAAAAAFPGVPEAGAMMSMIEPEGMELRHLELVRQVPQPAPTLA